jgi:hypothetical protein
MRDAHCCDCGIGTFAIDEWFMLDDQVWEQAWSGRRKSWQRRLADFENAEQPYLFEMSSRAPKSSASAVWKIGSVARFAEMISPTRRSTILINTSIPTDCSTVWRPM